MSAVSHQVPVPLVIATPGMGYRNVGQKKTNFDMWSDGTTMAPWMAQTDSERPNTRERNICRVHFAEYKIKREVP